MVCVSNKPRFLRPDISQDHHLLHVCHGSHLPIKQGDHSPKQCLKLAAHFPHLPVVSQFDSHADTYQ